MEASLRTNADLTIYNRYIDAATRSEKWSRSQVKGVAWENRRAATKLATGGTVKDNNATIYIPKARDAYYLDPREWDALADKSGYWTLRDGDYILRGLASDELSASFTPSDLKAKYNDVMRISSVDLYDNGSRNLQHWRVGAA